MIEVTSCVICEGVIRKVKGALVAPFLAKRIWNRKPFCVDLVECKVCGFMFYNPRPDDEELQRQYKGYRSQEYLEMRHFFEPWYTTKFNLSLASDQHYATRRGHLSSIFRKHTSDRQINRILDYGGDHGNLILGLFENAELFLYDISGARAAKGVIPVSDPGLCKADLIINSNVLEHVGFPRVLVDQILTATPQGGLAFIEVPAEVSLGPKRIFRRIAQIAIMSIKRPELMTQLLHRSALYMMREHINYFTEGCLTTLLRCCGSTVVASGSYPLVAPVGNDCAVWCLVQNGKSIQPGTAQ